MSNYSVVPRIQPIRVYYTHLYYRFRTAILVVFLTCCVT